jgi:hypothetical protein
VRLPSPPATGCPVCRGRRAISRRKLAVSRTEEAMAFEDPSRRSATPETGARLGSKMHLSRGSAVRMALFRTRGRTRACAYRSRTAQRLLATVEVQLRDGVPAPMAPSPADCRGRHEECSDRTVQKFGEPGGQDSDTRAAQKRASPPLPTLENILDAAEPLSIRSTIRGARAARRSPAAAVSRSVVARRCTVGLDTVRSRDRNWPAWWPSCSGVPCRQAHTDASPGDDRSGAARLPSSRRSAMEDRLASMSRCGASRTRISAARSSASAT